jgi:hypothetical protein
MAKSTSKPKHHPATCKQTKADTAGLDFTSKLEEDPAWQMLHKPAKIINYIPPEKLEELIEEEMTECLHMQQNKPQPSTRPTNISKNSKPTT